MNEAGGPGVRFGYGLPMFNDHLVDGRISLAGLARKAEDAGFASLWTSEVPTASMMDSLVMLGHVAAATERVELGLGLVLLPLRTPAILAREAATIDILSEGRLILGFGFGRKRDETYAEYGLTTDGRLHRYLGSVSVLQQLLEKGSAHYDGPEWVFDGHVQIPEPVRRPRPPILLGARDETAVRRVVGLADGWIVSASAPRDELARSFEIVHEELEAIGRDPSTFTITSRMFSLLDPTPDTLTRMEAMYRRVYGADGASHSSAASIGDTDEMAERIDWLIGLGAQHVIMNPVLDYERHLDLFASEVLPKLVAA